jgi:hypothetical protein
LIPHRAGSLFSNTNISSNSSTKLDFSLYVQWPKRVLFFFCKNKIKHLVDLSLYWDMNNDDLKTCVPQLLHSKFLPMTLQRSSTMSSTTVVDLVLITRSVPPDQERDERDALMRTVPSPFYCNIHGHFSYFSLKDKFAFYNQHRKS